MLKKRFHHKQFFSDIKVLIDEHAQLRQGKLDKTSMLNLDDDERPADEHTKYQTFDEVNEGRENSSSENPVQSIISKNHTWLSESLVSISSSGDSILISDGFNLVILIKLKMDADCETINKYIIKQMQLKNQIQDEEDVTCLLCLPIMSSQRTGIGLIDWTAIVVGYSSGYTRFYDEQSSCLMSLRFVEDEVVNLKLQTQRYNTNARSECHFSSLSDEFTIIHKNCAIIIDGFGLFENLTMAKKEASKGYSDPAYDAMNLPFVMTCKRWKLEGASTINDCDNYGLRKRSSFDTLVSTSISQQHDPAKICGQAILTTGQSPFIGCYRESNVATVHSYSDLIGSIFSIWKQKPPPSKTQMIDSSTSASLEIKDRDRLGISIISSPDKRLGAITDDFGRVILLDVTNWIAIRIWKGYRYAQCGWIETPRDVSETKCPRALFLVIYAPKRGLLEIWSAQRGPRVAAFNVGKDCLLLYNNHRMLNIRAGLLVGDNFNRLVDQSYSSNCSLLNPNDDSIYTIEVPYTFSLSKDGDLKSRDNLLLNELTYALKGEDNLDHIREILFKITLVESRSKAIHKMSTMSDLSPEILKNLLIDFKNHIFKCYKQLLDQNSNATGRDEEIFELPYDVMTVDDSLIIDLSNRIIMLCDLYTRLLQQEDDTSNYTKLSKKILAKYREHPEEIDEFAKKLGWTASEVARCISLLAMDQSFKREFENSPWPEVGEPLSWDEFISCFDLAIKADLDRNGRAQQQQQLSDRQVRDPKSMIMLQLSNMSLQSLNTDKIVKVASLMYSKLFSKSTKSSKEDTAADIDQYAYIDPATRLVLLYQFWLNAKLCNYWMTWESLQHLTSNISDDLSELAAQLPTRESYLIDAWKQVYNLILGSENLFAAIIATATVKNDTLRLIRENGESTSRVRNPKMSSEVEVSQDRQPVETVRHDDHIEQPEILDNSIGSWENLYIDAERLALLNSQLEDVLFLSLLLNYSHKEQRLVNRHIYKIKKISVMSILRGGPTLISELVAQWAVQSNLDMKIFVETYRDICPESGASKVKEKSNIYRSGQHDNPIATLCIVL